MVETVLASNAETWTNTNSMQYVLGGCYTRLLCKALSVSCTRHMTNKELYTDTTKTSDIIRSAGGKNNVQVTAPGIKKL